MDMLHRHYLNNVIYIPWCDMPSAKDRGIEILKTELCKEYMRVIYEVDYAELITFK